MTTLQPSRWDLREDLLSVIVGELHGPAEGPEEELTLRPTDRYLVGRIAPRGVLDPSEADTLPDDPLPSAEEDGDEDGALQAESLTPSSIGMTFAVDAEATAVLVHVAWGRYERAKSEKYETETGNPRTIWKRVPCGGWLEIALEEGTIGPHAPDVDLPEVVVRGRIRPSESGVWVVSLFLVNAQPEPETTKDTAWLLQPLLRVTATDREAAIFRRRPFVETRGAGGMFDTFEQASAELTHRRYVEFAVGHNVSVHADVLAESPDRARAIATAVLPVYEVPTTESPSEADGPEYAGLELDMKVLAEASDDELVEKLQRLSAGYRTWIERNERLLATKPDDLAPFDDTTEQVRATWRGALKRIEAGIETLRDDPNAAEAFRTSNRAMWLQRVHSEFARRRRRGEQVTIEQLDVPENRRWYPFQVAFMLVTLESATEPTHADRSHPVDAIVDLLWFPTGGGKTEAYLGLAAYVMALRRLEGVVDGYDGWSGVAVIMRYTLRLLTIQQFQRASALLCALEVIRRERAEAGDATLGKVPFRIGLWVGRRASPNTTDQAEQLLAQARDDTWRAGQGVGSPAQLTACPWCGSELRVGRDIRVDKDLRRTLTFCSDPLGRCPFSPRQAPAEGLPVVVVDEEVYRLLPSLIVATVDKFAQMPWRGDVQALFGRVTAVCPRHGFLTADSDDTGQHPKRGKHPATKRQETLPLRPPDLIIQDELHLISGPLGSLVGLYETAIDELCSWQLHGELVRPKVIASTATIRNAGQQVHGLFMRSVEVFPPPGLDVRDNFFARQRTPSPTKPGRRYLGICAPGRDRPSVLIRVYVALLSAAQQLFDEHGGAADPWMTVVGYFNSLRELGGMKRLVEDDVKTRAFRIDFDEDRVPRPGLAQRDVRVIEELTSRKSSADIPEILDRLETPFSGDAPVRPIDVLLATNMVSVGVDVRRLGTMIVNGQPKTTAEYIQATSRVGRASPGLVLTVLNWARPRDLSHFETFEHFHATYYKQVEALSLTPFAPRALDRGLTGVLASLIRASEPPYGPNAGAGLVRASDPALRALGDRITGRAWNVANLAATRDLVDAGLRQRLDDWAHEAEEPGRQLGYRASRDGQTVGLLREPSSERWAEFTTPTSLREVEPAVRLLLRAGSHAEAPGWEQPPGAQDPES